jgi:hypothetical protein
MSKTYVGDTGTVLTLDCGTSVSTATVRRILYTKPSGVTGAWTAAASGTDSIAYTTTAASDLDVAGIWLLQAEVTTAGGKWLGETVELQVYAAMR